MRNETFSGSGRLARLLTAVVLIVVIVAGARLLAHPGKATTASFDRTALISGPTRDIFVGDGVRSCMKKQASDPASMTLLPKETLNKYCSCFMNALADTTTFGDLDGVSESSLMSNMQSRLNAAGDRCAREIATDLPGGR